MSTPHSFSLEAFQSARRRAFIQDVLADLSGRSDDLLSFDKVREQLHLAEPNLAPSYEEIPLDKIVGSVGRYRDFNRAFLPRASIDPDRWTRIERLQGRASLPPIDVFKVGDVYFVRDGNHRVSVARSRSHKTIRARVIEVPTRVPLTSDTSPDDLILKSSYAEFLEKTSLDRICPEQCIQLTVAGGYHSLLQHIEVYQFYQGLRSKHYPTLEEAAEGWYHSIYEPVTERIRSSQMLRHFPGRTEADLYLWIAENRARLQMKYGGVDKAGEAVTEFAQETRRPAVLQWITGLIHKLFPRFQSRRPQGRSQPSDSEQ